MSDPTLKLPQRDIEVRVVIRFTRTVSGDRAKVILIDNDGKEYEATYTDFYDSDQYLTVHELS